MANEGNTIEAEPNGLILFFGRFHPVVVHLPIGFVILTWVLNTLAVFKKKEGFYDTLPVLLLLTAIASFISSVFGYLLSLSGGYDELLLSWHQWTGIGFTFIVFVLWIFYKRWLKSGDVPGKVSWSVLTISILLVSSVGHDGGSLTHGKTFLTDYMPNPGRRLIGLEPIIKKEKKIFTSPDSALIYNDLVQPMFESKCFSCHNADKMKGELRMDTPELLVEGGEHGAVFLPGNSNESELVIRMLLPKDDKKAMPPDGKTGLSPKQIEIVKWWIDSGASFDAKVIDMQPSPELLSMISKELGIVKKKKTVFDIPVEPIDISNYDSLKRKGLKVLDISDDNNYVQVNVNSDNIKESLEQLKPIAQNIVWLDLADSKVIDTDLVILKEFSHLTRLYLQNTKVSGLFCENVIELKYLNYINLSQTKLNLESFKCIARMPSLEYVNVWSTEILKNELDEVEKANQDLIVETGSDIILSTDTSIVF